MTLTTTELHMAERLFRVRLEMIRRLAERRKAREMMLDDLQNDLARVRWEKACAAYQLAVEDAERMDAVIDDSDALSQELQKDSVG